MTIQGAIEDLNNLINAKDIPVYYKPSIEKIKETIELENQKLSIKIPDNATNGQVCIATYPNAEVKMIKSDSTGFFAVYVRIGEGDKNGADFHYFDYDWWNAPYKGAQNLSEKSTGSESEEEK